MLQIAADQGLQCLPFFQQFLDISSESKLEMLKVNELSYPNIYGKYGIFQVRGQSEIYTGFTFFLLVGGVVWT